MAEIGTIVEGKYEILKQIGKGGMSKVYLAMDKNLNKQWAIKEIQKEARNKNNEVVIQSAIAEANLMKRLDHPCLPRIVDIINHDKMIYVVMDYIEGEPLSKILNQYGAQSQEDVLGWAESLCGVLDYLHTQNPPIIYRDMKPANIMLQPNGSIKLIDFGIAREYKETNIEDTVCLGTKGYAAPEQFGGHGQTDRRTDIYCLGVTLYHLLTGMNPCNPPYEIYPIRHWNQSLSVGLENIIIKCTQANPDDRFDSCAELLYALRHLEESDGAYRKKQVGKLVSVILTALFTGAFAGLGVGFLHLSERANTNTYDQYVRSAETSVVDEEKIDFYNKAIELYPGIVDPYLGIVNTYKSDAVFSVEEEKELKKIVNANMQALRESPDYGELAYEIGKSYWYYYDYGKTEDMDNQITRMKSSIQWFHDAISYGSEDADYYKLATTYEKIGLFYKEITLSIEEASDQGMYIEYFNNLKLLCDDMSDEDTELIRLEVYKLCVSSLETYAYKFSVDGVSKEAQSEFLEKLMNEVKNMITSTDKTKAMRQEVLSREKNTAQAIEKAYLL